MAELLDSRTSRLHVDDVPPPPPLPAISMMESPPQPPMHSPLTRSPTKLKAFVMAATKMHVDPWQEFHIDKLPAEHVKRHRYNPTDGTWINDDSIVKIESKPFDKGAQRQVYRMKKISQAPTAHWSMIDWAKAPNYVAKCYITNDGSINMDPVHRQQVYDDIKHQYEAAFWAQEFNKAGPPKKIIVIQCYVLEFIDRPGSPVLGCERFVDGHDKYGAGFVKHNSNSGYVETHEARSTPQAFSAHSFYSSKGTIMVVDVQGVGDLYTDPQIHSTDLRFGESDLGIRGMALFFVSFRRNPVCDVISLPRFPLSNNERKRLNQLVTMDIAGAEQTGIRLTPSPLPALHRKRRTSNLRKTQVEMERNFDKLVMQRCQSKNSLLDLAALDNDNDSITTNELVSPSEQQQLPITKSGTGKLQPPVLDSEELDEMVSTLEEVEIDLHRNPEETLNPDQLNTNLGLVHWELAILEASGRFTNLNPDFASCLFHICIAAKLGCVTALLALGRLRLGLETEILDHLHTYIHEDIPKALLLLKMAAGRGSIAAACLAGSCYERLNDDDGAFTMYHKALELLEASKIHDKDTTIGTTTAVGENEVTTTNSSIATIVSYNVGDEVEVNYFGSGSWYPATIVTVATAENASYTIVFQGETDSQEVAITEIRPLAQPSLTMDIINTTTDTESAEDLSLMMASTNHSLLEESNDTTTTEGDPQSMEEVITGDESARLSPYELWAALGKLYSTGGKEFSKDVELAVKYYTMASEEAMKLGKVALAVKYTNYASELDG